MSGSRPAAARSQRRCCASRCARPRLISPACRPPMTPASPPTGARHERPPGLAVRHRRQARRQDLRLRSRGPPDRRFGSAARRDARRRDRSPMPRCVHLAALRSTSARPRPGRFASAPGRNDKGEAIVWVDYDASFAIHRLRPRRQRNDAPPGWHRRRPTTSGSRSAASSCRSSSSSRSSP